MGQPPGSFECNRLISSLESCHGALGTQYNGTGKQGMTDPFKAAKLVRKRRTKWWREHIAFAYIVVTSSFALVFFSVRLIDRRLPEWLTALGVSPSGVNLIIGTAWFGLGLWVSAQGAMEWV
jgi:hypothetical protein